MKIAVLIFVIFLTANLFGQVNKDLQALAETEKAFARFASEKGTKAAFLEFTAPDGIMFTPNASNALNYWNSRDEWKGLLSWQPSFADVSSNGILGWTTGPWEHHPEGKNGKAASWGEFVTVWQKQADGRYKFVLDIGISHAQAQVDGIEWKSPVVAGENRLERQVSAGDVANGFFKMSVNNISRAYKNYAAEDIRVLREGKMPILGKDNFLAELKKDKMNVAFNKIGSFFGSADMAYTFNTYTLTRADKTTEKGNFVQVWKLRDGKWLIVLDLFNPIPEEKK